MGVKMEQYVVSSENPNNKGTFFHFPLYTMGKRIKDHETCKSLDVPSVLSSWLASDAIEGCSMVQPDTVEVSPHTMTPDLYVESHYNFPLQ